MLLGAQLRQTFAVFSTTFPELDDDFEDDEDVEDVEDFEDVEDVEDFEDVEDVEDVGDVEDEDEEDFGFDGLYSSSSATRMKGSIYFTLGSITSRMVLPVSNMLAQNPFSASISSTSSPAGLIHTRVNVWAFGFLAGGRDLASLETGRS